MKKFFGYLILLLIFAAYCGALFTNNLRDGIITSVIVFSVICAIWLAIWLIISDDE